MVVSDYRTAIRAALLTALGWDSGSPEDETRVQWEDSGESCVFRPPTYVDLLETSGRSVGVDETRVSFDPDDEEDIDSVQCGLREITVQVKAISDAACGDTSAASVIQAVRLRLRRPSILAILQAASLAVVRFENTQRASYSQDNRMMDVRILDVVFSSSDTDVRDPDGGGYFNTAQVDYQEP